MTRRRIRGSTQDDVRRHNLGTILTEVHRHGYRSRALLTAEMGLNRSTIGDLVAELTEAGIVIERSASARGRAGAAVAGGRALPGRAVRPRRRPRRASPRGGARRARRRPARPRRRGVRARLERPGHHRRGDRAYVRTPAGERPGGRPLRGRRDLRPGVVRHDELGLLRFAPNLGWIDLPLGARLGERLEPAPAFNRQRRRPRRARRTLAWRRRRPRSRRRGLRREIGNRRRHPDRGAATRDAADTPGRSATCE